MIEVTRRIEAAPQDVFGVLADGWLYSGWVVGASAIRSVDESWPAVGTRIHHSIGVWPLLINDTTQVRECLPHRRLVLVARGWPVGEGTVELDLEDDGAGECLVRMREDASSGLIRFVPKPLRQAAIVPRNAESLRRLGLLVQGRRGGAPQ